MPRVAITVSGSHTQPYRFQLDREKVTIGRSSSNDIVADCPSVSGTHCTMERVKGGYILRDQDSTNGLELDDTKMEVIDLRNGIEVLVGDATFEYSLTREELDDLDEEDFVPHAKKASGKSQKKATDEEGESKRKKETPAKKREIARVSTPPRSPAPIPALPSASSGGGFFGLAMLICGLLAFCAGLGHSYSKKQKEAGREGEVSLFLDIREGRPPLPDGDQEPAPKQ